MLTSKRRPPIFVHMYCPAGVLVPRPPTGVLRAKWQKFYNWPRNPDGTPVEDYQGGPEGVEKVVQVPKDQYHGRLIARGPARLARPAEIRAAEAVEPDKKPAKKDKGGK